MPMGPIKPLHNLSRDVQRKLGRMVWMLQLYERALKVLLANSNIEIVQTDDGLRHNLDDNKESVRTKTLGQLVKQYTGGNVLLAKEENSEQVAESGDDEVPYDGKIRVKISYSTEVNADEFSNVKSRLAELVEMRNGLVHHFLERFDLQTEGSLREASDYLDESYSRVDAEYVRLRQHLMAMDEARKHYSEVMSSPQFKHFLSPEGIDAEGCEHFWPFTPVVAALREAEQKLATEGCTKLNDAIIYIGKHYPEDFPKRYRFKRWDELIKATNLFELGKSKLPENQTVVFYRTHQAAMALTERNEWAKLKKSASKPCHR